MESKKLRAVTYCRVSTEEETQKNALGSQIKEAVHAIEEKDWILVDQYIDEGKSGTTTKHRDEYNRLCRDIERDIFDVVVIKSQDRLMRNTLEWYIFIDRLNKNGKKLFFYLDNRFYDPGDSLIVGIKAILAEEYSRDLSKKINNAHKNRQKEGKVISITSKTWGYDKKGKEVVINKEEAEVVRYIYDLCIQGYGSRLISKALQSKGICSRSGKSFAEITVRKIIRNPLYRGDAVMNRLHIDFDSKKTIHVPENEWIIHRDAVPAIVSRDIWEKANKEMDKRSRENRVDNSKRIGAKKGDFLLSGKIICGECGNIYWRRRTRAANNEMTIYWSCSEYVIRGRIHNNSLKGKNKLADLRTEGGCDNIHLKDADIMNALRLVAEKIASGSDDSLADEGVNILTSIGKGKEDCEYLEQEVSFIKTKQDKLLDSYLNGVVSADMYQRKSKELEEELKKKEQALYQIRRSEYTAIEKQEYLEQLKKEIFDISNREIVVYKLVKLIETITIYPKYLIINFGVLGTLRMDINRISYKKTEITFPKET